MSKESKDSGIEWIGQIPIDWDLRRAKYCGILSGNGVDKKIRDSEKIYKSVHYTDVYKSSLNVLYKSDYFLRVSADLKKAKAAGLQKGDLLLTNSSETPEDIGHSTLIGEDFEDILQGYHLMRFRPKQVLDSNFVRYYLGSHFCRSWFSFMSTGITRFGISKRGFTELPILIPKFIEQKKIGEFIENKIGIIDFVILQTKLTIEDYKLLKQSIITEAVTKGLDKTVEMKDSGVEWIKEIPKHWEIKRIKQLSKVHSSTRIFQEEYRESGIPFYRTKEIVELANDRPISAELFISQERYNELKHKKANRFDILISSIGTIGEVWICDGRDFYYKDGNITQIDSNQSFDSMYMKYLINSRIFKEAILYFESTTTISALSIEKINRVKVPIPPLDEQKMIIEFIDEKCNKIINMISKKEKLLLDLEAYKKSLIYEYVTGKKEVF